MDSRGVKPVLTSFLMMLGTFYSILCSIYLTMNFPSDLKMGLSHLGFTQELHFDMSKPHCTIVCLFCQANIHRAVVTSSSLGIHHVTLPRQTPHKINSCSIYLHPTERSGTSQPCSDRIIINSHVGFHIRLDSAASRE